MDSVFDKLIVSSGELDVALGKVVRTSSSSGETIQKSIAIDACLLASEHGRAYLALLKLGAYRSAETILRLQIDAVVHGAWALWVATEPQAEAVNQTIAFGMPHIIKDDPAPSPPSADDCDIETVEVPSGRTKLKLLLDAWNLPIDFMALMARLENYRYSPGTEHHYNLGCYFQEGPPQEIEMAFRDDELRLSNQLGVLATKMLAIATEQSTLLPAIDQLARDSRAMPVQRGLGIEGWYGAGARDEDRSGSDSS